MRPLFIGLYAAHYETRRYQSAIGLHALYQAEEFIHLLHAILARQLRPTPLAFWDVVGITTNYWVALFHVEPSGVPPLQRCVKRYGKVFARHSIPQLEVHPADHLGTSAASLL